ncbi:MAG: NAD(P)-dependent oxidoreductase [Deltaproteobacteria bacterium]|nr:NAD(P)-dependent oxidoreductase [Deltaproteobacteria bacterium]
MSSSRRATRRSNASSPPPPLPPSPRGTVAFLGLGAMGRPMAVRLVQSGYEVRVYNRTKNVATGLTKHGTSPFATPKECASGADVVITMLSDAEALANVLEGPVGVLAAFEANTRKPRPVLLEMSTIGRRAAIAAAKRVEEHGGKFVDAPVSGSVGPASRGELVALVGGSVSAVERVRPVLSALCKRVVHAGPVGQGQALKVILNGIGAHHLVALTSMLALAERAGLARDIVLEAFTSGAFATPSYIGKREKLLARDYTPEFSLTLTQKDCALNVALQEETGLSLPVLRAILTDVTAGIAEGLGELDLFALEKHYARL